MKNRIIKAVEDLRDRQRKAVERAKDPEVKRMLLSEAAGINHALDIIKGTD